MRTTDIFPSGATTATLAWHNVVFPIWHRKPKKKLFVTVKQEVGLNYIFILTWENKKMWKQYLLVYKQIMQ